MASWLRVIGMLALLAMLVACAPAHQRYAVEIDPNIYIVQTGDTLESIAWRFRTKPSKLILWNNLDSGRLTIGQKILVRRPPKLAKRTIREPTRRTPQANSQAQVTRSAKSRGVATAGSTTSCITCGVITKTPVAPPPAKKPAASTRRQRSSNAGGECRQPCGSGAKVDGVRWYWPADGRIVGRHGKNPGLDVAGQEGQTVRAAAAGSVVYSGPDMDDIGGLVIIEHSTHLLSTYANVGKLLVREGDKVQAGQPVARMWKENSKQAKLHFEIRKRGNPVNPERYLPKR